MELVGYRKRKYDAENPGVEDGCARRRRRERGTVSLRAGSGGKKRTAAGRECLSLARRYNTLDLAGKVSVPRGCGPFGNPGEEGRRRLCDRNGIVPVRGCDGAIQPVAACRGIAEIRLGRGATGARHFLRKWYYPLWHFLSSCGIQQSAVGQSAPPLDTSASKSRAFRGYARQMQAFALTSRPSASLI